MKRVGCIKYSLRRYDRLDGNFTQISNDIFKLTNGNEFKVYCYLCSNYNRELGYAFPSLNTISKNINMSIPTVTKCIKNLEELGLIKIGKLIDPSNNFICNFYEIYSPILTPKKLESEIFKEELEKWDKQIEEEIGNKLYNYKYAYNDIKKNSRSNYEYFKWRKDVLERDNYICRLCGKTNDETILNVHHIERYADNKELRTDINNGITLCYDCHKKIYGKEKEFEKYFKKLIINNG